MSIYIDPGKIEEMANGLRQFSKETEDMEARVYRMVSNLISKVNAEYKESYVRAVTKEIKQQLNEARKLAAETTEMLNNIAREADNAASEYRFNANNQAQAIMQSTMNCPEIDNDTTLENQVIINNTYQEDLGNQKDIVNPEDISGYELEKALIQTFEKIKMGIPEDGSKDCYQFTKTELLLIGLIIGVSEQDIDNYKFLLDRVDYWRAEHGLADPKNSSSGIDRAFIESLQNEIRKSIIDNEENKVEVYNLFIEIQNRYKELLKKAETGAYLKEYKELSKIPVTFGQADFYGYNVEEVYYLLQNSPDEAIRLFFDESMPALLQKAGFDFSGIEELFSSELTREEFINLMGPVWELMQEYRTFDDVLRDAGIVLAIVGAFATSMATASGAAVFKTVELAIGIADASLSLFKGDSKEFVLKLIFEFAPDIAEEFLGSIYKAAKGVDKIPELQGTIATVGEVLQAAENVVAKDIILEHIYDVND